MVPISIPKPRLASRLTLLFSLHPYPKLSQLPSPSFHSYITTPCQPCALLAHSLACLSLGPFVQLSLLCSLGFLFCLPLSLFPAPHPLMAQFSLLTMFRVLFVSLLWTRPDASGCLIFPSTTPLCFTHSASQAVNKIMGTQEFT